MNKFAIILVTLLLGGITLSCGQKLTPQEAAEQMIKDVDEAAKSGSVENFENVYKKYYEYVESLTPEEQVEFVNGTVFVEPSEATTDFVVQHIDSIIKMEYVVKMGTLTEEIYLKNLANTDKAPGDIQVDTIAVDSVL